MPQPPHHKILFITRAYSQQRGGMERLSYEMIQSLAKQTDIEATIINHQGHRLLSPVFLFGVVPKALRAARQADIVHLGDPLLSFLGWLIKRTVGKPIAVTVHGFDITYSNPLYRLYLRLFFRHFDMYLPISQRANELLNRHHLTGQRQVVNPGLHDQYYRPNINRSKLDLLIGQATNDNIVLLTVGRLVARKGQLWFIQHVLPHLPRHVLYVIAGSGPAGLAIRRTIRDQNLSEQVVLLGRVETGQLTVLYNTTDAFIQPNIKVKNDIEGFGLVLLEAALCQRPVR